MLGEGEGEMMCEQLWLKQVGTAIRHGQDNLNLQRWDFVDLKHDLLTASS
jgi:hypothetical protein